ncbi:MAG TPA: carboxypeptidase regulatory-like domain-containing protein [Pyrinomonadaceae bacterium]
MTKKLISVLLAGCFCLFVFAGATFAQGTTSRVTGTVTDSSGAAVSGATVTVTNEATGVALTTETSENGTYIFDLIQVGSYTLTVEKAGFKKLVSTKNTVNINQPATINAALEIGDVSATVNVESTVEQVQTSTSGNIGSTIEQRTLESLPIVGTRGRNPLDLLNFQPGVVFGGNTGGAVNVHGSRDRAFNFTLDGIDINDSSAGGSNFTPLRPNPDSVQEFQIITSNFTAELGRSSGAQVTLVTRSGTNRFSGNLFEYYQTPDFNAKSYPITIAGLAKEQFVQHIFGGSLGGPLFNPGFGEGTKAGWLRDKAFFFVNLQMLRAYDTALVTRTVYTQQARQGIFRYVQGRETINGQVVTYQNAPAGASNASVDANGNPIRPVCGGSITVNCINTYNIATTAPISIDPTLAGFINAMPLPNNFTTGDGLNTAGFNFASPQRERQYDFVTKLDFKVSDTNMFYIRYAQGEQSSFGDSGNGGRPIFPDSPNLVDTIRTPKNLAVNWRFSPTARFTNEFVFGISKFAFSFDTPEPDPSIPFTFLTIATPNTNFSYNARRLRTLQFVDNLTFDFSPHVIKAGVNFRFGRHIDDRSTVSGTNVEPVVTFSGAAGYNGFNLPTVSSATNPTGINTNDLTLLQNTVNNLLGRIGSISQAFVSDPSNPGAFAPAGTRWINKAFYPELDFYVQDNWRFRQNLVFDIGLRWEAKLNPSVDGRPILVPNQPVKLGAAPTNSLRWVEGDLFKNDFGKFLPSLGFAWDPFKTGKTSIRANYRISSDRIASFLFGSSIFQSTPGNNVGATNSAFGQGGGLYRNLGTVLSTLAPTSSPDILRQPPAFGTGSINVIDPDLKYPMVHSWSLSFQRELWKNNVLEVNYIGKKGTHLLGGYNANQVNIFAAAAGENFLEAFNKIREDIRINGTTNITYNSPLINALMTGSPTDNDGTARFRALVTTNTITQGNVASAALTVSQRTCQAPDVTAGVCTNAQLGRRLVELGGFTYLLQPFPQFTGGLNVFDSSDYSFYNALEIIFKRRIAGGLGFQLAYTLSKSMDNRSWDPSLSTVTTGSVQSASSTPFDLRDRRLNYSWSDFDRRHVFQGTYVYELPFGKDRWLSSGNKAVDYVFGGWQLSGTIIWMSGRPFTVYSGVNTVSNVVQSTADCSGCTRNSGQLILENGRNFWFDAATRAMFSAPAPGSVGNTGRNFFLAPRYFQTDASLSKKFRFTERMSFDVRVDARNLTNNPSFDNPTALITSNIFGRINDSVTNNARRIQLSGKFNF